MPSRYENTKVAKSKPTKKRNKSVLKYQTTIYDKVPELNTDMHVISTEGDRLDNLATQFYGNPNLWWFLARVNNISTMNVPAGTKMRIPANVDSARGD